MKIKTKLFGTSHSQTMGCAVYNLPKGFTIDVDYIQRQLSLRQKGVGRSERQNIEENELIVQSGLNNGKTNGKPLVIYIENADNDYLSKPPITALRPSHADLVGCRKYHLTNARYIAEITSGRNTLPYVILGAVLRQILHQKYGVKIFSRTLQIGKVICENCDNVDWEKVSDSPVRCSSDEISEKMVEEIKSAKEKGDTLGGITQIVAYNLPISYGQPDYLKKIQSVVSRYLMAIPSVKGIEFGLGFNFAEKRGSEALEKLTLDNGEIVYDTNYCGGTIGGMLNGKPLTVNLAVKPVPSVNMEYSTFDIVTKEKTTAHYERSDTCVVSNIGVIAENMLAAALFLEYE